MIVNKRPTVSRGFTIIELTIALAFLGILMICILTLTISAGKMYVKGVTNKTLNQTGRDIQDTIRQDFLSSNATDISPTIITEGPPAAGTGRICLGNITYLWNTAPTIISGAPYEIKQSDGKPIRLARMVDQGGTLCVSTSGTYPRVLPTDPTKFTEMIGGDNLGRDFAIYSFTIKNWDASGKTGLYELRYSIGTNEKNTTQAGTGTNTGYTLCQPPTTITANFDYCSVSDFDMIVRVGGGVN